MTRAEHPFHTVFHTARRTPAGHEAMAMVRKGRVRSIGGRGMRAQAGFAAELFQVPPNSSPAAPPPATQGNLCNGTPRRLLMPGMVAVRRVLLMGI